MVNCFENWAKTLWKSDKNILNDSKIMQLK